MHAEIIAIGDEITSGRLLDSNSQWLSLRVEELGIRVLYHATVGDELEPCADVFRRAIDRADVVVVTGGLGPTADDLTREAIAEATGRPLVLDPASLEHIRGIFARRRRDMPPRNERQALLPTGARMIPNPEGTAPGVLLEVPRTDRPPCRLFALPGVPAEMREMWHGTVAGELRQAGAGRRAVRYRQLNCFGAGESQIEAMLPDLVRRGRSPRVGINASRATIILRITAEGATDEECDAAIEPVAATIRDCLGNRVFGEGDQQLQDVLVELLRQRRRTLAVVEWGTAGLVNHWLGTAAGAGGPFLGGLVVADKAALPTALDVSADLVERHGSVSAETARAMAEHCRRRFGADYALSIGPFPPLDPKASEPASFFVAFVGPNGVVAHEFPYAGHPELLPILGAKRALNVARLALGAVET